jgi:hypothetical protein
VLCGKITGNRGTFAPKFDLGYLKQKYLYGLCRECHDKITMEQINKIEDMIYESESGDGKINA